MGALSIIFRGRRRLAEVVDRIERIDSEVLRQRREIRRALDLLVDAQLSLDALVRRAYLDLDLVEHPFRLAAQRFRGFSQNAEDGITLAAFREAGVATARFVELGCGTNGGNSGFLARELGWSGLMIDASEDALSEIRLRFNAERVKAVQAFVTRENVNELLEQHLVTDEVDLVSIDIDGNDYWIWEALTACSPRLVICEFNALFGPRRAVAVPYEPRRIYEPGATYYGASLAALTRLAERRGFRLVAVEPRGVNAFFLRADVAPGIPGCAPEQVFATILSPAQISADSIGAEKARRLLAREEELERLIRKRGLPLVEVS